MRRLRRATDTQLSSTIDKFSYSVATMASIALMISIGIA